MEIKPQSGYGIPVAIIIAGLLIAGTIFWNRGGENEASASASINTREQSSSEFRMPDETDHVRGNPEASIAIVEFSDLECPFCAQLHPTLKRIVEENNDVKWIYRHFPLSTIHPRALSAAVSSECVARLGSNDNFWTFVDAAFQNQRQLDEAWYKEQAVSFGIDSAEFASCVKDRSVVSDIQRDLAEATRSGGRGTPYVVVVTPSGEFLSFSGALPHAQVITVIEQARNN